MLDVQFVSQETNDVVFDRSWVVFGQPWRNLESMLGQFCLISFGKFLTSIFETFLLRKWSQNEAKIRAKIEPDFCPVFGYVFD